MGLRLGWGSLTPMPMTRSGTPSRLRRCAPMSSSSRDVRAAPAGTLTTSRSRSAQWPAPTRIPAPIAARSARTLAGRSAL